MTGKIKHTVWAAMAVTGMTLTSAAAQAQSSYNWNGEPSFLEEPLPEPLPDQVNRNSGNIGSNNQVVKKPEPSLFVMYQGQPIGGVPVPAIIRFKDPDTKCEYLIFQSMDNGRLVDTKIEGRRGVNCEFTEGPYAVGRKRMSDTEWFGYDPNARQPQTRGNTAFPYQPEPYINPDIKSETKTSDNTYPGGEQPADPGEPTRIYFGD